jgi:hypothetical protein
MRWIAKDQPIYVWRSDSWFNERDGLVYTPDMEKQAWVNGDKSFPFTKKTMKMDKENDQ